MEGDGSLKPHSTHNTIKWLEDNYHLEDGVCLPRSLIYEHYLDYCQRDRSQPVNAASFGKIIRQQFTTLTTRRLGTRGQSKYHYFGLGIKPTSLYYTKDYTDKLEAGVGRKTPDNKKQAPSHDKPSAALPPFPNVYTLTISDTIPMEKLKTFVVMYRAHCQRIVDSVVRANFNEVENFLLHFWKGMPTHLLPVLACDVVVDLVAHCDCILYRVINNVLISSPLQCVPESLANDIRTFSEGLRQWLETALVGLPESLQEAKYKVAEGFANSIKRQTALTQLAEVTRNTLRANNMLDQLKEDWSAIDLLAVYTQVLYLLQPLSIPSRYQQMIPTFLQEFGMLLDNSTDLDQLLEWAKKTVNHTVTKAHVDDHSSLKQASQAFLLTWKSFTSKIIRELTLASAPSFGCFHLLHMLVDDYIVHLLEDELERQEERTYTSRLEERRTGDLPLIDSEERLHHSPSPQSPSSMFSSPDSSVLPPSPPTAQEVSFSTLRSVATDSSHPITSTLPPLTSSTLPQSDPRPLGQAKSFHSSYPHLPFTGPQPGGFPQQQQQQQQYPAYQPASTTSPRPPGATGYDVLAHSSYRSTSSSLSHTAPLSSSTVAAYSSFPEPSSGLIPHAGILPHVASFPSFSVPTTSTFTPSSSSSSNLAAPSNLSLFSQGVYPYAPFMSISPLPAPQPFVASIPGQTSGYPYLSPSLYTSGSHGPVTTADHGKLKQ